VVRKLVLPSLAALIRHAVQTQVGLQVLGQRLTLRGGLGGPSYRLGCNAKSLRPLTVRLHLGEDRLVQLRRDRALLLRRQELIQKLRRDARSLRVLLLLRVADLLLERGGQICLRLLLL